MPLLRATLVATATGVIYFPRHVFTERKVVFKSIRVWSPDTDFVSVTAIKESRHRPGEWSMAQQKHGLRSVVFPVDWTFEFSDAYVTAVAAATVGDIFYEEIEIE